MKHTGLTVVFKTKPGMRDRLRELWETYVKKHASESKAVCSSYYCYDIHDADKIILFEVLSDTSALQKSMQQEWFKTYQNLMSDFLAEEPQVSVLKVRKCGDDAARTHDPHAARV